MERDINMTKAEMIEKLKYIIKYCDERVYNEGGDWAYAVELHSKLQEVRNLCAILADEPLNDFCVGFPVSSKAKQKKTK